MNDIETFQMVKKIVSEHLGVPQEKIFLESNFEKDLGADSLDVVELIMKFEYEFDIDINDGVASKITTVQHSLDYIKKYRTDIN